MSDVVHRLWQQLPHGFRRWLFAEASRFMVPRPARLSALDSPYVVVGALRSPTGLGEAARLTAKALKALGEDVRVIDLTAALRQPAVVGAPEWLPPEPGPGTLLVFGNPPVASYSLARIPRQLLRGKTRIGCWVWEYAEIPAGWRRDASLFHAVAAPSRFCLAGIQAKLALPCFLLPYPFLGRQYWAQTHAAHDRFNIGFIGDAVAAGDRKNAGAVVRAVAAAFPNDPSVTLTLVLNGADAASGRAIALRALAAQLGVALSVDDRLLDEVAHRERLARFDAYVSLHRAEGLGLTLVEAMAAGVPVVATGAPPVDEFLSPDTGYPIPYNMTPAPSLIDTPAPGLWAEPDIAAAAKALRALRAEPAEAARRSTNAVLRLEEIYGLAAFSRALREGLAATRGRFDRA